MVLFQHLNAFKFLKISHRTQYIILLWFRCHRSIKNALITRIMWSKGVSVSVGAGGVFISVLSWPHVYHAHCSHVVELQKDFHVSAWMLVPLCLPQWYSHIFQFIMLEMNYALIYSTTPQRHHLHLIAYSLRYLSRWYLKQFADFASARSKSILGYSPICQFTSPYFASRSRYNRWLLF